MFANMISGLLIYSQPKLCWIAIKTWKILEEVARETLIMFLAPHNMIFIEIL